MLDIIFRSGTLIDGSGNPRLQADVGIVGDLISKVGDLHDFDAHEILDISGQIISPGFIDIHTHSDLTLISNPLAQSKIRQGVTTEVIGNCGFGVAPIPSGSNKETLRAAVAYLDLDPEVEWTWKSVSEYMSLMDSVKPSLNVAVLVGHIPIHTAVVGFGKEIASTSEIVAMQALLRESLSSGAFGFSTGLAYSPITYASNEELLGLAKVVQEFDSYFAWHMRDYGDNLLKSVDEVIAVAKQTGVRTQISHLVSVGQRNWGTVKEVLSRIDRANSSGTEISVDVYPYIAGNCPLSQFLPDWAQEGGDRAMRSRMKDIAIKKQIVEEWDSPLISWSEVQVSAVLPGREELIGRTIADIAASESIDGDECALQLLSDMGNAIGIIAFGRTESDVRTVFDHPSALVGSDGQSLDPLGATGTGSPHPRSYGCYPRLLRSYVGKDGISLERAIHISTKAVAMKLKLPKRGEITNSHIADIVVFDPLRVSDLATYANPHQFPTGISHVMVNGRFAIKDELHIKSREGKILRKSV